MSWQCICIRAERRIMGKFRFYAGSIAVCLMFNLFGISSAYAGATEAMESLLMPGDVSKAHARYEKQCKK